MLSLDLAGEEEDQEPVPQLYSDSERGSVSQKYQKTCTHSENEPTPSEMMLFGERRRESDQENKKRPAQEEPSEKNEPTIDEMIQQFYPRGLLYG